MSYECAGYVEDEFWQRLVHQLRGGVNSAAWQYNEAMTSMCQSLRVDTPSSAHIEAVLVTCVVLVSPALFQGDTKAATSHMRFGYQLLVAEGQIRQEPLCSHSDADIRSWTSAASVYISRSGGLEASGADFKNDGIYQTALERVQAWKSHLDVFGKFCYFGTIDQGRGCRVDTGGLQCLSLLGLISFILNTYPSRTRFVRGTMDFGVMKLQTALVMAYGILLCCWVSVGDKI